MITLFDPFTGQLTVVPDKVELASTVVTNANLTGAITSVGNATSLGSFSTSELNAALNDNDVATLAGTETLTNKRINYRIKSEASAASPTINVDSYDIYEVSAQTTAIDFANANITGTPTNGQILELSIASSTTTSRAITYGTNIVQSTIPLPVATSATTAPITITLQYQANYAGGAKWVCKGVA